MCALTPSNSGEKNSIRKVVELFYLNKTFCKWVFISLMLFSTAMAYYRAGFYLIDTTLDIKAPEKGSFEVQFTPMTIFDDDEEGKLRAKVYQMLRSHRLEQMVATRLLVKNQIEASQENIENMKKKINFKRIHTERQAIEYIHRDPEFGLQVIEEIFSTLEVLLSELKLTSQKHTIQILDAPVATDIRLIDQLITKWLMALFLYPLLVLVALVIKTSVMDLKEIIKTVEQGKNG